MSRTSRLVGILVAGTAAFLLLSGCNSADAPEGVAVVKSMVEGELVIATGDPAYAPWVHNDDPASGEGFEAAIAYAVIEEMGYRAENVEWIRTSFAEAIAPGPKNFDLNIQQLSVTSERAENVDFSAPYYQTSLAVIAAPGSAAALATDIVALKDVALGVANGTTSFEVAENIIAPTAPARVFSSQHETVVALQNGDIDAILVDLPSAIHIRDVQFRGNAVIVGRIENDADGMFAFVLPKGSILTGDVSAAVERLREDGTLAQLVNTWLSDFDVPVLK